MQEEPTPIMRTRNDPTAVVGSLSIADLLETWRSRLGLHDWIIVLKFEDNPSIEDGKPVLMSINRSEFYKQASLTISQGVLSPALLPDCIDKDLFEAESWKGWHKYVETQLVHELLHCHVTDLMYVGDLVREQLAAPAIEIWDKAWRRAEEAMVDSLATAIVNAWPK